jgi:putative aldouronate transport system permease protein
MRVKQTPGERVFTICNALILSVLVLVILYPVLHILFASFSDSTELLKHEGLLLHPVGFSLDGYKAVLQNANIYSGYSNTLFIVIVGTVLNLFLTLIGAYVLSRKGVMWNNVLTILIVLTMYFNGGLIPFFLVVKGVGLNNNLLALILPTAVNTFNLIIMRTGMAAVPDSIEESAKLDGASHLVILFKIMVPLTKATIAVIALYYAVAHWNAWFNAMIFLRDRSKFPLQLILREILIQNDTSSMTAGGGGDTFIIGESVKYATIVAATLPILCVLPFVQKFFVKGVMIGAVKG